MTDLAVRYAEALMKAAKQENALPVITDEMQYLAQEFSGSAKLFYAPVFPVREQLATVEYVLNGKFHPLTKRFVCLLAFMRRLGGIGRITDVFVNMAHKEMKRLDLHITVFDEITPEMTAELVRSACGEGLFDSEYLEKINVHIETDKNLQGGFIAECDGLSWDCSLRTRLLDMSKALRRI